MDLKRLTPKDAGCVNQVFQHNGAYFQIVTGKPPGPQDLEEYFYDLPPGKTLEDKLLYGVYEAETCVALVDLLKDYPKAGTYFLGLLMVDQGHQGRGYGKKIYRQVENMVKTMGVKSLRLGVVAGNPAKGFWQRMGFYPIKTTLPMAFGNHRLRVHVMEKRIGGINEQQNTD